jgi:hypothetical protein
MLHNTIPSGMPVRSYLIFSGKTMRFIKRHATKIFFAAAVLMLLGGLIAGEHNRFFTYAIVICLDCIGIG